MDATSPPQAEPGPETRIWTWTRRVGDLTYTCSTDRRLVQLDAINAAFASDMLYWARPMVPEVLRRCVEHSMCFGLYVSERGCGGGDDGGGDGGGSEGACVELDLPLSNPPPSEYHRIFQCCTAHGTLHPYLHTSSHPPPTPYPQQPPLPQPRPQQRPRWSASRGS